LSSWSQGTYSEDYCADVVLKASCADSFLVSFGSTRLLRKNEPGTDPDTGSSKHESSGKRVAVEQTTSSNNLHRLASERADLALAEFGHGGDKNCCRNITSVTTTFTTLGANDIRTDIDSLLHVLGMANHVHVENSIFVKFIDNGLGRNTDGRDEELSAALNDDVDKFVKLALCVIVTLTVSRHATIMLPNSKNDRKTYFVLRALPPT
jgi:hypothetical protein